MATLATPPHPLWAARNRSQVHLWLPRLSLSRCIRATVVRSTLGQGMRWPAEWHDNHFPATPYCSLGWFLRGHADRLPPDGPPERLPQVYFTGPFTRPTRSRNSAEGHGMIVMLMPDAVQALTGLSPAGFINQVVPVEAVLDTEWQAMTQAVMAAPTDAARLGVLEDFLDPRWQARRPDGSGPNGRHLQDWAEGLALRAATSGIGHSLRAAERRIKGWAGLPMRELRGMGRAEQAFLRSASSPEGAVDWAGLADDAGYADQSHLCRETRRITGFSPAELRRRIEQDESFWIYRIWG